MQERQLSRSEQKIQKMNSSMVVFRELIESLRLKNQQLMKPSSSDINPQAQKQSSTHSRLYCSDKVDNKSIINNSNTTNINNNLILSSSSMPVGEDDGIKLKARANVAGRDILNKKPSVVSSQKFNETVSSVKDIAKNKNISGGLPLANDREQKHAGLQQIKMLIKKQVSVNFKNQGQNFIQESQNQINKNMTTMPLIRPKFQQNKLNLKAIASRNKIKDINQASVIKYCKQSRGLHQGSHANEIFDFFDGLMTQTNVAIVSPFIKKFKNCVYFGAPVSDDQTYEGFLYFYENKIYYGQFLKSQKNGKGVELFLDDEFIFKGIFREGQKTGKFLVKKQNQTYVGFLEKGIYHGQGKLQTKQSIYEGQFENGQKHGFGEEFFPKTGVKMVGYFDQGTFSKRSKSSFSHSDIEKAIKFKSSESRKAMHSNKINKSNNTSIIEQEVEGTINQNGKFPNEFGLYTPPFSSSNNFQNRKMSFNKQKIRSFLPGMAYQKFIDPMPENCRDFDYSFDVSSKKDTENLTLVGLNQGRNRAEKQKRGFLPPFPQIQQEQYHMDTSAIQQPLPMPSFFKK